MTDQRRVGVVLTNPTDKFMRVQCSRARSPGDRRIDILNTEHFFIFFLHGKKCRWELCVMELEELTDQVSLSWEWKPEVGGLRWGTVCTSLLLLAVTSFPCSDRLQSLPTLQPATISVGAALPTSTNMMTAWARTSCEAHHGRQTADTSHTPLLSCPHLPPVLLSPRHARRVQAEPPDRVDRGEVPQAVPAVETKCSVVQDCRSVSTYANNQGTIRTVRMWSVICYLSKLW